VEKMKNYTRNEWGRCKTTLQTSEKDSAKTFFKHVVLLAIQNCHQKYQ
jgi:hypothetical protein